MLICYHKNIIVFLQKYLVTKPVSISITILSVQNINSITSITRFELFWMLTLIFRAFNLSAELPRSLLPLYL
jgi:hypothetical protein